MNYEELHKSCFQLCARISRRRFEGIANYITLNEALLALEHTKIVDFIGDDTSYLVMVIDFCNGLVL